MENLGQWAQQTRHAWRQVHLKCHNKGHCTRTIPWTWRQFREWFEQHLEEGVTLGLCHELSHGEWDELRKACLRGMMLPRKAPF